MNKTIEREYFKAFERGGTAYKCVEVIKRKYDLGYLPQNTPEEENELAQFSPEEERERKDHTSRGHRCCGARQQTDNPDARTARGSA